MYEAKRENKNISPKTDSVVKILTHFNLPVSSTIKITLGTIMVSCRALFIFRWSFSRGPKKCTGTTWPICETHPTCLSDTTLQHICDGKLVFCKKCPKLLLLLFISYVKQVTQVHSNLHFPSTSIIKYNGTMGANNDHFSHSINIHEMRYNINT